MRVAETDIYRKAREVSARTGRPYEAVLTELMKEYSVDNQVKVQAELATVGSKKLIGLHDTCTCQNGRRYIPAKHKWIPCEDCERGLKWKTSFEKVKNENGDDVLDRLAIPLNYRKDMDFKIDTLSMLDCKSPTLIHDIQLFMQGIEDSISQGRVKACSFYLHIFSDLCRKSGVDIDLKKWVYKNMVEGVKRGLGVVPFITMKQLTDLATVANLDVDKVAYLEHTSELDLTSALDISNKGILKTAEMLKVTYTSYATADLCFIEASANSPKNQWRVLKDLMIERAKYSLPTYVIGYWSLKATGQELYFVDYTNSGRLDLFKVMELGYDECKGNAVNIQNRKAYPDTNSRISTGVNVKEFMGSRD